MTAAAGTSSLLTVRSVFSPALTRRLARRRFAPSRPLHTTTSVLAATSSKPAPSLIPPPTALSALLSRLSLPPSTNLHSALIACLTHPSYVSSLDQQASEETTTTTTTEENNELLSTLGNSLLGLFASEHLSTLYPLLPTHALQNAITAYVGPSALVSVARELGVSVQGGGNTPGVPGYGKGSNSAGLAVRWSKTAIAEQAWRDRREGDVSTGPEKVPVGKRFEKFVKNQQQEGEEGASATGGQKSRKGKREGFEGVVASSVRAFVGLIYQEQGIHAARAFVHAHFLSRSLDLSTLFSFKNPMHVLTSVISTHLSSAGVPLSSNAGIIESRLLASTGVASQSPLFLIGLFLPSGIKLAEGHGSSKSMAEHRAAVNALLSLYLVRGDQELSSLLTGSEDTKTGRKIGEFGEGLPTSAHEESLLSRGKVLIGENEGEYQGIAWGGREVIVESRRKL
ncbi:hypothetical protein CI109_102363 [Kwoniella shandongensis]|uniref:Large ribosomal subunit protein mL44 n=1 Tax=Kwoniella shandongensis TaxID=1734106 RepID=A0A5M6C5F9_9TREE|nr:uncharacterized protein CI109_003319 [Kwoniella shandongensis]KAA5528419.1 hypothetical protein CI109_003319 [Kwoniella shandongensis]